eukprot:TRINITY_DN16541_c0_g1_i1.p2 TRINITY_DN16541_c0_g1~~TRINITY_DN16541_c0_g1_i1.p2  ORF type:complete len:119 (-),score=8.38 TRINITY_DN16541_c0_g1_i1:163-519(-)
MTYQFVHGLRIAQMINLFTMGGVIGNYEIGGWRKGRATFYGNEDWLWSIHQGSCGYEYLCQDEGTGWDIAAMPDTHQDYQDHCGRCYEVKCDAVVFQDSFGNTLGDQVTYCLSCACIQ